MNTNQNTHDSYEARKERRDHAVHVANVNFCWLVGLALAAAVWIIANL